MQEMRRNLEQIRLNVASACRRTGRDPGEVVLVAVTKTCPVAAIEQAISLGIGIVGENRVQEASEKYRHIGDKVEWHLIGHLQSNKARKAVEMFSLIHSIDSVELAAEVGRRALQQGKVQDVLLEVNTSGEPQKYGFAPQVVGGGIRKIGAIGGVRVLGLMTVGPLTDDDDRIRGTFRMLRTLFEQIRDQALPNIEMKHLSMGMSGDYQIAIEEGSTMIRVGSAIFGARG